MKIHHLIFTVIITLSTSSIYATECKSEKDAANKARFSNKVDLKERIDTAKALENCELSALINSDKSNFQDNKMAYDLSKAQTENAKKDALFADNNFGIGFAISFPSKKTVDNADIVNDVVVASSIRKNQARVILEFHTLEWYVTETSGFGPFAALVSEEDNAISGIGLGVLWSKKSLAKDDNSAFSIGIGAILDNEVKDLADGFEVGKAPPTGETSVRYTTESQTSLMIFVSNNF